MSIVRDQAQEVHAHGSKAVTSQMAKGGMLSTTGLSHACMGKLVSIFLRTLPRRSNPVGRTSDPRSTATQTEIR